MLVLTMTWNIEDKLKFGQIKQENVRLFRHGDFTVYPKWAWGTEFNLTAYLHAEKAHFP